MTSNSDLNQLREEGNRPNTSEHHTQYTIEGMTFIEVSLFIFQKETSNNKLPYTSNLV